MPSDHLSATFAALADPTRRAILARLVSGEASVTELAEPFEISLQAISKHLKVLERGGLIVRGRAAQSRPCRIRPKAFKEVDAWLDRYRGFWGASLDRLEHYLQELQAKETKGGRKR
jgi:DNA-binding transcriptional ArsR family regulator